MPSGKASPIWSNTLISRRSPQPTSTNSNARSRSPSPTTTLYWPIASTSRETSKTTPSNDLRTLPDDAGKRSSSAPTRDQPISRDSTGTRPHARRPPRPPRRKHLARLLHPHRHHRPRPAHRHRPRTDRRVPPPPPPASPTRTGPARRGSEEPGGTGSDVEIPRPDGIPRTRPAECDKRDARGPSEGDARHAAELRRPHEGSRQDPPSAPV